MIPKKIHYCWFGRNPKPKSVEKCINSWHKYCSDYEIIEWNEDNFDISASIYTMSAYNQRKYAFLTDYVRLLIVYQYGGIYFDTDVELIRSTDDLLDNSAFFGFENNNYVNTGIGFGAEKGNKIVKLMLEEYNDLPDSSFARCTELNTRALMKVGLVPNGQKQTLNGNIIYPPEYFCPKDYWTGVISLTKNTYSIHHFDASWFSKEQQIEKKQRWNKAKKEHYKDIVIRFPNRFFRALLGNKCYESIKKYIKRKRTIQSGNK